MYPQKCPKKKKPALLKWEQIQPLLCLPETAQRQSGGGHKEIPIHDCKTFIKTYEIEK